VSEGAAASDAAAESKAVTQPAARAVTRRSLLFWVAALVILAGDLWTKSLVCDYLGFEPGAYASYDQFRRASPPLRRNLIGERVRLVATLNPGMMWGAFDRHPALLKVVRPLAVLVIFLLLGSIPAGQWSSRLALGGILGGALGNIYDSFRYIGVRDFLQIDLNIPVFDPFPAFNLADSAICVGVAILAIGMMRAPKEPAMPPEPSAS